MKYKDRFIDDNRRTGNQSGLRMIVFGNSESGKTNTIVFFMAKIVDLFDSILCLCCSEYEKYNGLQKKNNSIKIYSRIGNRDISTNRVCNYFLRDYNTIINNIKRRKEKTHGYIPKKRLVIIEDAMGLMKRNAGFHDEVVNMFVNDRKEGFSFIFTDQVFTGGGIYEIRENINMVILTQNMGDHYIKLFRENFCPMLNLRTFKRLIYTYLHNYQQLVIDIKKIKKDPLNLMGGLFILKCPLIKIKYK